MASQYVKLPVSGGAGPGAGVDSFNGRTGVVVSQAGDYSGGTISNTPAGNISATNVQAAINELDSEKQDVVSVGNDKFLATDGSGVVIAAPGLTVDTTTSGILQQLTEHPDGNTQSYAINSKNANLDPDQNSPNETWTLNSNQINIDTQNSGFTIGTSSQAVYIQTNNINHIGTSDIGAVNLVSNNFNLGNGTDPIDVKGFSYGYGFGTVNANVNINGPMQGYGYQPNINASATIDPTTYTTVFYDGANIGCASPNYTSLNLGPNIASINNNNNYTGINIGANVTTFTGNASYNGIAINPTLGTFNQNGSFNGLNIGPTITSARYAAGINVSMDNVTPYAGIASTLTEQDITYTFIAAGDNNFYTLEYTPGATAGSEVVTILGNAITVQIDSGVSTATQVKAAWDGSPAATAITATISGTASDPQVTFGPNNFINGVQPGNIQAAYLDGNVEITGNLTFGGALSIGQLNAFYQAALVNGGGQVSSMQSLVTSPTVAANVTVANADTIGVNTAMLLNIGANATVTTSFVGLAALGLPAVVTMGAGSTVDQVSGATFALSLDGAAGGGTIANLDLCRSIAIPNGITAVTKLAGYKFDLPFGDPGTTTWGFYASPTSHNYFAGDLLIGGTAGSDDVVENSSVGLELDSTTKAFLPSRMTTTQRNALTALNGMVLYNTTDDKLQVYAAGSWVDLH